MGFEYISKYKTADDGIVVNHSTIAGLSVFPGMPFYSSAKLAVVHTSRCLGDIAHYNRTKVRVIAICPGATNTILFRAGLQRMYSEEYQDLLDKQVKATPHKLQE